MNIDKRFFEVNVGKYDSSKSFNLYCPSSLNNPRDNSVMFCTKEHLAEADSLNRVKNCLVFWPQETEAPSQMEQHIFVPAANPRQAYAMFFSENQITYYSKPCEFDTVNGAYICKGAAIGKNAVIFPGAYIDAEVVIGDNCYIASGVKLIGHVLIGNDVVIRENTVIGADGLTTMRKADGTAATIPQFGGVVIEDGVQFGANTVIARGAIDNTVIRRGSKIDNSCFISHNVQVGADTFIVGETIMFGSSSTGERAFISGNSTVRDGIHIGSEAFVGMGAVVVKPVPDGTAVKGNPAK